MICLDQSANFTTFSVFPWIVYVLFACRVILCTNFIVIIIIITIVVTL